VPVGDRPDVQPIQPGNTKLPAYFCRGERGPQRVVEIPAQHRWLTGCILPRQRLRGSNGGRAAEIHNEHDGAGLGTPGNCLPQGSRVVQMMEEAAREDHVVAFGRQVDIRDATVNQGVAALL